jgi:hypothetical protein
VSELLGGLALGELGAGALVAIIVLLVLLGRLVPRQQLLDVQANCDKWQASSEKWQQVATQHGMTLERLIDYAEAADHALAAIQDVVKQHGGPT